MSPIPESVLKERREEILTAALVCFGEKGFVATRMTDIAARIGMSVGNLYNYFKNKGAIIEALADREINQLDEKIRWAQSRPDDREEHSQALQALALARLNLQNAIFALDVMKAAMQNPRLAAILHRFDTSCRQLLLDAYIRSGIQEPEKRLELDMCLIDGLTIRVIANPSLDSKRLAENVAKRIVGTV